MRFPGNSALKVWGRAAFATIFLGASAFGQAENPSAQAAKPQDLDAQIRSLSNSLEQTRAELAESRTEIRQLRGALEEMMKKVDGLSAKQPGADTVASAEALKNPQRAKPEESQGQSQTSVSQDDWDILNARLEEQRQVKVESGSKYRLKLSGLALFNTSIISGQVNNLDLPDVALHPTPGSSTGSVSGSVRQSIVGLTGFGPDILGARTSGDVQMDFFGGLPPGYAGGSSGVARVRLARMRMDWKNTSVVAGLDYPFFSPNSPTSYMTIAEPSFSSAGNLWAWTPTIWVEQRFDGALSPFKVEAGFFDVSSGMNYGNTMGDRYPSSAESSRQPTYALRFSASTNSKDRPATIGVGGVYTPQRYFGGYDIPGWAATLDWKFPLLPRTELSGEFFTGRAIDGFGGLAQSPVAPQNPAYYANVIAPELANLGTIGGWSQLKFRVDARSEFNVAAGTGGRNSAQLREASVVDRFLTNVPARNQMLFVNYIFKPRSDLLFSAEYRRIRTYGVNGSPDTAGQVGLAFGFLF